MHMHMHMHMHMDAHAHAHAQVELLGTTADLDAELNPEDTSLAILAGGGGGVPAGLYRDPLCRRPASLHPLHFTPH